MPVNRASGSEYGIFRIIRKMSVKIVDRKASTRRELMNAETLACVMSHSDRTVAWFFGASQRQIDARKRGPAAHR